MLVETGDAGDHLSVGGARPTGAWNIDMGADDDAMSAGRAAGVVVDGGSGDDILEGGPADDDLYGGPGADRLHGLHGDDQLNGDSHPLAAAPDGAPDLLDGGAGRDEASYMREDPLAIDLATEVGGAPGEGDRFTSIEDVAGGDGGNVVYGDDGPNRLRGAWLPTRIGDTIDGLGGDDLLMGSSLADSLMGGPGDDVIWLDGGDSVSCGEGRDRAKASAVVKGGVALVPPDCEEVRAWGFVHTAFVRSADGVLRTLAFGRNGQVCGGRLTLRSTDGRRTLYGNVRWRRRDRRRGPMRVRVALRLTAAGRMAADLDQIAQVRTIPYATCRGGWSAWLEEFRYWRVKL